MIGVARDYFLAIYIGDAFVPLQPSMLKEVSITCDLSRFVPVCRLAFHETGNFTNIFPYDKTLNKLTIEFGRSTGSSLLNRAEFTIIRRTPDISGGIYEVEGFLNVEGLFNSVYKRGWSRNISDVISQIAEKELNIPQEDQVISPALNYKKNLIQPHWTNAHWFAYLQKRLIGKNGQTNWVCTIHNLVGKKVFWFRSLEEIINDRSKFNFIVGERTFEGCLPIFDLKLIDNSSIISFICSPRQLYKYFDWRKGKYIEDYVEVKSLPSLTDYFLIDEGHIGEGIPFEYFGRTTDFNPTFKDIARGRFLDQIMDSVQLWCQAPGIENIFPGDIVKIIFSESLVRGNMFIYQHSGYWMVKRVVHLFSTSFITRLLLVRSGIDTEQQTTLIQSERPKR